MREKKKKKPRVCVCTVRTTGHKFQHSRPLLVRPDTDAINPRVRRALFSSLSLFSLKGFLILFFLLLLLFPCVFGFSLLAGYIAASGCTQQQPASLQEEEYIRGKKNG